jgi:hypothetical protein
VKLLTYGYTGASVEELARVLAARPDALVVDVRYSPFSRNSEWSGSALRERFGAAYFHVKPFGNVNYRSGGPVRLDDPEGGVRLLLAALERCGFGPAREPTVILLCACRARAGCHRDDVARLLVRALGAVDQGECPPAPPAPSSQLLFW